MLPGTGCSHDLARRVQVATFFAAMKDSDYAVKEKFINNFWKGFREARPAAAASEGRAGRGAKGSATPTQTLKGRNASLIQDFKKCDFTLIYNHCEAERQKKKDLPNEARNRPLCSAGTQGLPKPLHTARRRRSA